MTRLSSIYKTFDVVIVQFPYTTDNRTKQRPALIISSHNLFNNLVNHSVLAMITSSSRYAWPHDIPITDPYSCGLQKDCRIRFKICTIDNRLIKYGIGRLSEADRRKVQQSMGHLFKEILALEQM